MNLAPPLDLYVQILTFEDCGMIWNGNNFIELQKDKIYFLKKSLISHLIVRGLVKQI